MNVLIPSAEGVIENQWVMGLREAGHNVFTHFFNPYASGNDGPSIQSMIEKEEIRGVLCFGDDPEGTLLGVCQKNNLPLALWHLDAPYQFFLPEYRRQYRNIYHFCMDSYYVELLKKIGYENVAYLPLGTTPSIFRPMEKNREDFRAEVGMVANLAIRKTHLHWEEILESWKGKNQDDQVFGLINELIATASNTGIDFMAAIRLLERRGLDLHLILHIIKFIESMAGFERRKKPVLALQNLFDLKVVGEGWEYVGLYPHQIHPRIGYYDELPIFYSTIVINLNATQPQIKRGLNQRFFDVPACGGLLISDWNDEIPNFFIPGKEVVIYNDIKDLPEIVRYYLERDEEREAIAQAARAKILSHHTMQRRMETIMHVLQNNNRKSIR
jgi:spore maturation protein CgeB